LSGGSVAFLLLAKLADSFAANDRALAEGALAAVDGAGFGASVSIGCADSVSAGAWDDS
jgi:hypothetical protein